MTLSFLGFGCRFRDHVEVGDPALVHAILRQFVDLLMELSVGRRSVDRGPHSRETRQRCRYPVERIAVAVDR